MVSTGRLLGGAWAAVLLLAVALTAAEREVSLIDAVRAGDAAAARALLAKGDDVNAAERDGTTVLHWAVEHDQADLVTELLQAGARARVANRYGITPLHVAATNGNARVIALLLDAGADVNAALPSGETPVMTAARTGSADAVRTLVERGADVAATERLKKQTALMWAAAENNAGAIEVLTGAGADVAAKSEGGFTPFLFAVRGGHQEAAAALLEAGADVDETLPDGMSALVLALYNAHYELASFLLDRGADPNASAQGWTALHQLAWSRRPNRGFNLPGAVPTGSIDSLELVKKLVERGADINARMTKEPRDGNRNMLNRIGSTPFLMAAKSADVPLMRALLDAGADASLTNADGTSAVMVAAGVGVYGPGESPGTHEEALEAVKLAHEAGGGDVNDVDINGETALHGAVYRGGAVPVLKYLVEHGARLDVQNAKKWTPLFAAEGVVYASSGIRRYPEAAAYLRSAMVAQGIEVDEAGRLTGRSLAAGRTTTARAQRTLAEGVFSALQAARGQQVYRRACSACHLESLKGDAVSPSLIGPEFMNRYAGSSLHDMISAIRGSMPQNAPDSLGDQGYVDLVSYLLSANGSPSGAEDLPIDVNELGRILVTTTQTQSR